MLNDDIETMDYEALRSELDAAMTRAKLIREVMKAMMDAGDVRLYVVADWIIDAAERGKVKRETTMSELHRAVQSRFARKPEIYSSREDLITVVDRMASEQCIEVKDSGRSELTKPRRWWRDPVFQFLTIPEDAARMAVMMRGDDDAF
jgi:hypothetical protein